MQQASNGTIINVGELWRVKLPGKHKVIDVQITEMTDFTVVLTEKSLSAQFGIPELGERYLIDDVLFIEQYDEDSNADSD